MMAITNEQWERRREDGAGPVMAVGYTASTYYRRWCTSVEQAKRWVESCAFASGFVIFVNKLIWAGANWIQEGSWIEQHGCD